MLALGDADGEGAEGALHGVDLGVDGGDGGVHLFAVARDDDGEVAFALGLCGCVVVLGVLAWRKAARGGTRTEMSVLPALLSSFATLAPLGPAMKG